MGLLTFCCCALPVLLAGARIVDKRPDYAAYQASVPPFFPNPTKNCSPSSECASRAKYQAPHGLVATACRAGRSYRLRQSTAAPRQSWFFDVRIDDKDLGFHKFNLPQASSGYTMDATVEFRHNLGVTVSLTITRLTSATTPTMPAKYFQQNQDQWQNAVSQWPRDSRGFCFVDPTGDPCGREMLNDVCLLDTQIALAIANPQWPDR